ncbi:MAG: PHP domain-containing protein, partial [Acetanaerobacterium sp.]
MDIRQAKSIAETHCHTVASSHAYSTLLENITYAKRYGMRALAITEHCSQMPDGPYFWFFDNLISVDRVIDDIIILRGAEADIVTPEGGIDLTEKTLDRLDWVIASFHFALGENARISDYTDAYIGVAKNKHVRVIGHCGTEAFRFDYERGIKAFKEYGKIVEINAHSFVVRKGATKNCAEIA